ncbi:MAG: NERD domain-containing protein [bacterium]
MAKMIPARNYTDFHGSGAERRVFDVFEEKLPDEYKVFHSELWYKAPGQHQGDQPRGEIDFLIAHPEKGLLVLEIKGGGVGYEPETDTWYSVGRQGKHELNRSPAEQARAGMFNLLNRIKKHPGLSSGGRFPGVVGWGLFFPDLNRDKGIGFPDLELPMERILFREDMDTIEESIEELYSFCNSQVKFTGSLDAQKWEILSGRFLRRQFNIVESLGHYIKKTEQDLLRLTEDQYKLLDVLDRQQDVFVQGCAGSGKTLLSLEKASRLAADGKKVLWLCYNKNLREHIEEGVEDENIEVSHFHSFAISCLRRAGIQFKFPNQEDEEAPGWDEFWSEIVPQLLSEAAEIIDDKYDALIIDEAQDFQDEWFISLLDFIPEAGERWLYVFYDPNQSIYGEVPGWLEEWARNFYPLNENVRNTRNVSEVSLQLGDIDQKVDHGPPGEPVRVDLAESEAEIPDLMRRAVHRLFNEEDVDQDNTVILTRHSKSNSPLAEVDKLGNYRIVKTSGGNRNQVLWSTIKSFKGLEADVVLLVIPECKEKCGLEYYTGASRAKHLLWIFTADQSLAERIQNT